MIFLPALLMSWQAVGLSRGRELKCFSGGVMILAVPVGLSRGRELKCPDELSGVDQRGRPLTRS